MSFFVRKYTIYVYASSFVSVISIYNFFVTSYLIIQVITNYHTKLIYLFIHRSVMELFVNFVDIQDSHWTFVNVSNLEIITQSFADNDITSGRKLIDVIEQSGVNKIPFVYNQARIKKFSSASYRRDGSWCTRMHVSPCENRCAKSVRSRAASINRVTRHLYTSDLLGIESIFHALEHAEPRQREQHAAN